MDNRSLTPDMATGGTPLTADQLLVLNLSLELSLKAANKRADAAWAVINEDYWRNHYDDLEAIAALLSDPVALVRRTVHAEARLEAAIAVRVTTDPSDRSSDRVIAALTDTAAPELDPAAAIELLADPMELIRRADHAEVIIGEVYWASTVTGIDSAELVGIQLWKYDRYEQVATVHRL